MSARANVKKLVEKLADAAQALDVAEREQAQLVRSGDESAWQDARRSVAFCRGYHGGLEDALALIQETGPTPEEERTT